MKLFEFVKEFTKAEKGFNIAMDDIDKSFYDNSIFFNK